MKFFYLMLSIAFNVVSYLLYKSVSNKPGGMLWIVVFGSGLALGAINVYFFTKARRVYLLDGLVVPCPLR